MRLTTTTSPALRTGVQAALAEGAIRLLEVLPEPDLDVNASDRALLLIITTAAVALAQNWVERLAGHKVLVPRTDEPYRPLP